MASFTSQYQVQVTDNGDGTFTPGFFPSTSPITYTDGDAGSDTFTSGETVSIVGGGPTSVVIGTAGAGFVVQIQGGSQDGQYYYVSFDDAPPNPVVVDPEGSFTVCFLAGTLIATPMGDRRIEDLTASDEVLTATGETRPVLWIGRQTVTSLFADPMRSYPIRISAGALGENIPARDLHVSPDHAVLVDDVLVQAGALVNGSSIARMDKPEATFTYYHIELEDHALVLAEGAVAETFVDNVTRRRFDNYAEYEALFGDSEPHIAELELPRIKSARQMPQTLQARLAARAVTLGFIEAQAAA